MKAFVELPLRLVVMCLGIMLLSCGSSNQLGHDLVDLEIIDITNVTTEKVRGYPSAFGVILGKMTDGSEVLVAVPAAEQRQILASYSELNAGQTIQLRLLPWADRPATVDSSYLANDFSDHYDLKLFLALH